MANLQAELNEVAACERALFGEKLNVNFALLQHEYTEQTTRQQQRYQSRDEKNFADCWRLAEIASPVCHLNNCLLQEFTGLWKSPKRVEHGTCSGMNEKTRSDSNVNFDTTFSVH